MPAMPRKKEYPDRKVATFPQGTLALLDAIVGLQADVTDFIRQAVGKAIRHRLATDPQARERVAGLGAVHPDNLPSMDAWDMPRDEIDKPMLPLVEALHATGWVKTRFSCEGHQRRRHLRLPYVDFEAPENVAAATSLVLTAAWEANRLSYPWVLRGVFIDDLNPTLVWELMLDPEYTRRWARDKRDADIRTLADILPPAIKMAGDTASLAFLRIDKPGRPSL
jgi:hypothetical protein